MSWAEFRLEGLYQARAAESDPGQGGKLRRADRSERRSDGLPAVLSALADVRTRPQALAHLLLAVPDEVLRRCGVILAELARD